MDARVKDLWVAALENGEFKQTKHTLRRKVKGEYSHCCLGVLCELYARENPESAQGWERASYIASGAQGDAFLSTTGDLPMVVVDWAGLEQRDPVIDNVPTNPKETLMFTRLSLSELNDSGYTFDEIAAVIREDL